MAPFNRCDMLLRARSLSIRELCCRYGGGVTVHQHWPGSEHKPDPDESSTEVLFLRGPSNRLVVGIVRNS